MFNTIKKMITSCLEAVYVDYITDSIYEIPADQTKFIMGK